MTTGEKLQKLRKDNNYTQEELADFLGVSRQSISKWESDGAFPETEKLIALAKLYNCSLDYLLRNDYESTKENDVVVSKPKIRQPYSGKRKVLYIIFKILLIVLTCSTIFSLLLLSISEKDCICSVDRGYKNLNMLWIYWAFLPIPICCLVFGIVMTIRKKKSVSNIVIGSIFTFFLSIYGSFPVFFKSVYIKDLDYWNYLDSTINLNLPDDVSAIREESEANDGTFETSFKSVLTFNSKYSFHTFQSSIDERWRTTFSNDAVPYSYAREVSEGFDKYLIYCFDTNECNPSSFISERKYVVISLTEAKMGMYLCEYYAK